VTPLPQAVADRALLARVFQENELVQQVPAPSWSDYLAAVQAALADWLSQGVPGLFSLMDARLAQALLWLLLALVAAILGVQMLRAVGQGRRRPAALAVTASVPGPPPPGTDRRREIEACLGRGDVPAAVQALWWWLAGSLCGADVDASWTSRELLARAQRVDLGPLARALDRMAYAARRPAAAEVRELVARFEAALA